MLGARRRHRLATPIDSAAFARELARRGLTQEEFAWRAGLAVMTVSRAARGRRLRPRTLAIIAERLATIPVLPGADLVLTGPGRDTGQSAR